MQNNIYKQELIQRLLVLANSIEAEGKTAKTIRDAIAYVIAN
jgi:hypothetical protein